MSAAADALMGIFGFKRVEGEGMKTDRELLELAARAAGYVLTDGSQGYRTFRCKGGVEWNPLTDDGDALRLAVNLELDILRFPAFGEAQVCSQDGVADEAESTSICPYAATRRAIVRAAAAIGEQMK